MTMTSKFLHLNDIITA